MKYDMKWLVNIYFFFVSAVDLQRCSQKSKKKKKKRLHFSDECIQGIILCFEAIRVKSDQEHALTR